MGEPPPSHGSRSAFELEVQFRRAVEVLGHLVALGGVRAVVKVAAGVLVSLAGPGVFVGKRPGDVGGRLIEFPLLLRLVAEFDAPVVRDEF